MSAPIVLLTHEFAPFRGGAATYVQEIAAAAARVGIEVEVWAPTRGILDHEPIDGVRVVRLPSSGRLSPAGLGALGVALAANRRRLFGRAVVLLSAGAHMAWAALHSAGVLPARNVTAFFHGSEIFKFQGSMWWERSIRSLYAACGGYAAASEFVSKLVRESRIANSRKELQLAACAVPYRLMQAAQSSSPMPHSDDRLRLLTVARLHSRKGQVETAQALGRLPAALRDRIVYQMVGVGDESYRRDIETTAKLAGVACEFSGSLEAADLAEAYRDCDLYVQTSRTLVRSVEGFGISYLEAAAFGKPSAGFASGGVGEAVLDGVTGLLAPEGDVEGFAAHVRALLEESALRSRMGEAGRAYAQKFSWEESAKALCAFARRHAS